MKTLTYVLAAIAVGALSVGLAQTTLVVATVNNPDMITMQSLTSHFEERYPDIQISWVTLPENELRQRVTTDIATGAGSFDVLTIGTYEAPFWGENEWLEPLDDLPPSYEVEDLLEPVRNGLTHDGTLYALPFYAESSMTYYRTDLFEEAGLEMPEQPSWDDIAGFAESLHAPGENQYGICLRGLPGWGQNTAFFSTLVNTFGGRWFDMDWQPQLTSPEWTAAAEFYVEMVNEYGPPGVTSNGYVENLNLFADGRCAMWVDATIAGSFLIDPEESNVAGDVGFARAPVAETERGSHWLWSWALAIPRTSNNIEEAQTFIQWATSQDYVELVAAEEGWESAPQGTRASTYEHEAYQEAVPFAALVRELIQDADYNNPSAQEVPYQGIQFVSIPEFQSIGTSVGQTLASIVAGDRSVEEGLQRAQESTERLMRDAGYLD